MIFLILVIIFMVLSSFFSGFETAFITANPLKIYGKLQSNKKEGKVLELFHQMDRVINTILVGNNIAVVSAAIFFSFFFRQWYAFDEAMLYSTTILTLFMLIFSEILPKAFSMKHSTAIVIHFSGILRFFMVLFYPLALFLGFLNRILLKKNQKNNFISREEVEFLFYKEQMPEKYEDEVDFIYRVLNLSGNRAREIMIPLNEITAVPLNAPPELVQETLQKKYYSRLPVYDKDIFNLVGYIPSRRFLFDPTQKIKDFMKETLFFPETKAADEVLFEMQKAKKPLAFIVDEYGAVSGIISKEDMVELIVGDLEDELHQEDPIISQGESWLVPGGDSLERINERCGLQLKKEGFETLSGFMAFHLKKIPEQDDSLHYQGKVFRVLEVYGRVASRIEITDSE